MRGTVTYIIPYFNEALCCSYIHFVFVDSQCEAESGEVCVAGFCSELCNIHTNLCAEGRTCIGGRCHTNCQTDSGECVANWQTPWLGQCHQTCIVSKINGSITDVQLALVLFLY